MGIKEPYIGGHTGGIPESAINKMGNSIITGISGQTKIHRIISPDVFYFADATVHGFGFQAWVTSEGYLQTEARTLGWQNDPNKKHPDIYTAHLTQAAKRHYLQQGKTIRGFEAYYDGKGTLADNYNQFITNLRSQPNPDSTEAKLTAARSTHGSIVAEQTGFTKIQSVNFDEKDQTIRILFT